MKTWLDWSSYRDAGMGDAYADIPKTGGDFAKAVAVCINSKVCQSAQQKGLMCPSYRASGDPLLSPGGRVKLLKATLNSAEVRWDSPELVAAMDTCVSCKGCRRECEAELDMAMIKVEYQAQRIAREGASLRSQMFGHLPVWLHRFPWLGRMVAWRNRSPWLARFTERLLGIDARAMLPEALTGAIDATHPDAAGKVSDGAREVVLLVDSFTRYYDPDIMRAAVHVLEAAGCTVVQARPLADAAEPDRPLCCGRTYLSQGMVAEARREARRTLDALRPHIASGRTVIGLEPACLLALRDEWKALGLGEGVAELASQSLLLEEFLAREQLPTPLAFKPAHVPLLVHGHCHQKAAGAMKSLRKVLKLIPGLDFEFVEASCCGMAGSFGLEAEHAQMARTMAEQALLPRLRQQPEAAVLSNGYSCRSQIRAGAERRAIHLAQWLRDHLAADGLEPADPLG